MTEQLLLPLALGRSGILLRRENQHAGAAERAGNISPVMRKEENRPCELLHEGITDTSVKPIGTPVPCCFT
jgi:hypothetical protein